jgi:hypothetical protein
LAIWILLLVWVLVGCELQRAVERLLEMPLLNREYPGRERAHLGGLLLDLASLLEDRRLLPLNELAASVQRFWVSRASSRACASFFASASCWGRASLARRA